MDPILNLEVSLACVHVGRVQPGPQEHTLRNVLVDSMKAERSALVRGDGQAVLAFMRRSRGARLLIGAWNQDGDRAYNRCPHLLHLFSTRSQLRFVLDFHT